MIYWLLIIILANLFFALASLGDKLILSGRPNPKSYTFYVGILSLLAVLLIPFANFSLPDSFGFIWITLGSLIYILGLYSLYSALERFEVSKVVATVGAVQPVFVFILT